MRLLKPWHSLVAAAIAGAFTVLGSAPFTFWPLLILPLAFTIYLSEHRSQAVHLFAFAFFMGYFTLGISWVVIPIHRFGHTPLFAAGILTAVFVVFLSILSIIPFYCTYRLRLASFWCWPIAFTLAELLRCTAFTGFPWLLLGYGHVDSPLGVLLPIIGPLGVTFASVIMCTLMARAWQYRYAWIFIAVGLGLHLWPDEPKPYVTTEASVILLQGNIPQALKWHQAQQNVDTYLRLWHSSQDADLVIFPEAAFEIPRPYADPLLESMEEHLDLLEQGVLLGVPSEDPTSQKMQNVLLGLGTAKGSYAKRHLVPFGEYVPFGLRGIIDLFSIPVFDMISGEDTVLLTTPFGSILPTICYEVGFVELWRSQVPLASMVVSVVNNAWFGHSLAPQQQFQMIRALAKAVARPIYQAGNTGVTALVGPDGQVINQLECFTEGQLTAPMITYSGTTPFTQMGYFPLWLVMIGISLAHWRSIGKRRKQT
ncbi:MAG: apolipoprotein N-acyltransferase [Legionellales bacterium]|nr:apolipoprotein N-acyltransferase [Legionellales bacterium]